MNNNRNIKDEIEEHAVNIVKTFLSRKCGCDNVTTFFNDKTPLQDGSFTYCGRRFYLQIKGSNIDTTAKQALDRKYVIDGSINLLVYFYVINIDLDDHNSGEILYIVPCKELVSKFIKSGKNTLAFSKVNYSSLNNENISVFQESINNYYRDGTNRITFSMSEIEKFDEITGTFNFNNAEKIENSIIVPVTVTSLKSNGFTLLHELKNDEQVVSKMSLPSISIAGLDLIKFDFVNENIIQLVHQKNFIKILINIEKNETTTDYSLPFNPNFIDDYIKIANFFAFTQQIEQKNEVLNQVAKLKELKTMISSFMITDFKNLLLNNEDYVFLYNMLNNKIEYTNEKSDFQVFSFNNDKLVLCHQTKSLGKYILNREDTIKCTLGEHVYEDDISLLYIFADLPPIYLECVNIEFKYTLKKNILFFKKYKNYDLTKFFFNYLNWLYVYGTPEDASFIFHEITRGYIINKFDINDETSIINLINMLQFKSMFTNLKIADKKNLINLLERDYDDKKICQKIKFCVYILLRDVDEIEKSYDEFDSEEKAEIEKWPIFNIFKKLVKA